ncbi:hypothetical protein [Sporosarcina newyorkensis]|uniref:hypothetical protein n=2 Tax=Sporosarcina newyorkensis TaxID=759851 RepID=UPI00099930F7
MYFEPTTMTVADFMDYRFKGYTEVSLKDNTQLNFEKAIRFQIKSAIGKFRFRLRSLTHAILQQFANDLYRESYAKKSLSIYGNVVNHALRRAVHPWGLNKEKSYANPSYDERKRSEKELKILPIEDLKKISEQLKEDHPLYFPFHIGLHTGLQVSEVWACGDISS